MKKIGQGWQYTVYDIGDNRVLKKFNNPTTSFFVILKELIYFKDFRFWMVPKYMKEVRKNAKLSLRLLDLLDLDPEWFGNVEWVSKLDFKQDKVEMLSEFFKTSTEYESRRMIDDFIEFNQKILQYHIGDKTFNITQNFGLNKKGEIVLIDLGELYAGEDLKEQIDNRIWKEKYVVGLLPKNVQEYFIKQMDKKIKLYSK